MTIYRNGTKYELTKKEMEDAFYEQETIFDKEDIKEVLEGWSKDDFLDLGVTKEELEECHLDDIVELKREYMIKYNSDLINGVITDAIKDFVTYHM